MVFAIHAQASKSRNDEDDFTDMFLGERIEHLFVPPNDEDGPSGTCTDRILATPLPELPEQADKLITWMATRYKPGEYVDIRPERYMAIAGTETRDALILLVQYLIRTKKLEGDEHGNWEAHVRVSFEGWAHYRELIRGAVKSRRAFMAMAFNKPDLDDLVEKCFRPAIRQTGFELTRIDDEPEAGLIDTRLLVKIRLARFLIADLTHGNQGAYWEAGFAEGLGKPVIYTCRKEVFDDPSTKPHFDTNHHQTILWEGSSPQKAAENLKATIRNTLPGEAVMEDPPA